MDVDVDVDWEDDGDEDEDDEDEEDVDDGLTVGLLRLLFLGVPVVDTSAVVVEEGRLFAVPTSSTFLPFPETTISPSALHIAAPTSTA